MLRARGFTLVELVIVIVLLAIVASVSVQFVAYSTQGAIDTASRQQRALTGAVISEQVSRALRIALPTSVRTTADGRCIEWLPVRAASTYLSLPQGSNPTTFEAVPLPNGDSAQGRIVVYGYGSNLYDLSNPGPMSGAATVPAYAGAASGPDTITVTLAQPHRFSGQSPERRFYVVGEPVSLCQGGGYLFRYRNYGFNASTATGLPATLPNREVLAANLAADSVNFRFTPPSLQRSAVVDFSFVLEDSQTGETLAISQEVQVRNVP